MDSPRFHLLGLPLGMFVEADENGGDFLKEKKVGLFFIGEI